MEGWGHVTTVREVIRGDVSPVGRHSTRAGGSRKGREDQGQVDSDQPPHIEGRNGSRDNILQREGRRHGKGKRL